ncbi:MAG: SDR family NAD(P)-dependent oxidoreductase [Acidobacteria bacterium]|nr:MAG: SDR family NAD(P)-dependent oxidoreductase [Acidobacteriota bacterium]
MTRLDGKVALVTGAGGGLGAEHAKLLARCGAAVVVNDLGGARDGTGSGSTMADQVVEEIRGAGGRAVADYGSVSAKVDAEAMVRRAVDEFGQLDIVVNNAGILRDKSFKKMTDEMWDVVLDVHLRGTYLVTKAAYDQMLAQEKGGRIVMTSSTSGLLGNFGQTNYGAAKAGIAGFMRCLALEGVKANITVNLLAPFAYSRLTEDLMPEQAAAPLAPDKVSAAVAWLCSDDASDVTGRTFVVGGNKVYLLSWEAFEIVAKPPTEEALTVDEVGAAMRSSIERWPKLLSAADFM